MSGVQRLAGEVGRWEDAVPFCVLCVVELFGVEEADVGVVSFPDTPILSWLLPDPT